MALNSLSLLGSSNSTGTAVAEIFPSTSTDKVFVMEVRMTLNSPVLTTASTFGLGVPAAKGVGRTLTSGTNNLLPEDPSTLASTTYMATAWTTQPTAPTQFFRRVTLANVAMSTWTWTFPNGLSISPQQSIVVWNLTNNDLPLIDVLLDE